MSDENVNLSTAKLLERGEAQTSDKGMWEKAIDTVKDTLGFDINKPVIDQLSDTNATIRPSQDISLCGRSDDFPTNETVNKVNRTVLDKVVDTDVRIRPSHDISLSGRSDDFPSNVENKGIWDSVKETVKSSIGLDPHKTVLEQIPKGSSDAGVRTSSDISLSGRTDDFPTNAVKDKESEKTDLAETFSV